MRRTGPAILAALATLAVMAAPAPAQGIDQTCELALVRAEDDTANTLFVDTSAKYWTIHYTAVPGTRIRIEGRFPHARYMSWNVYDNQLRSIDSMPDFALAPDAGSTNPFVAGADRTATARDYTAFIEFAPRPASPAPNTIYAGQTQDGRPTTAGIVWYRIYIPDSGRDQYGDVGLPRVTLESAAGGDPAIAPVDCTQNEGLPSSGAPNDLVDSQDGLPNVGVTGGYPGRNPPKWHKFVNLATSFSEVMLDNPSGEQFRDDAEQFNQRFGEGGIGNNRDIAYVYTPTSRGFGRVLVLHAKAPTFADTRGGAATMPSKQLRYWSFCQYEPLSQRVTGCVADDEAALDQSGRYTIVISPPGERPANATTACGVNWLPWGPQSHGLVIYRHMLADPSFANAIQQIPQQGEEQAVMGPYYPTGEYLPDRAAFEARGCPAN